MPMLPGPGIEENRGLRAQGLDAYPSTTGEVLGAVYEDSWTRNPGPTLKRAFDRTADLDMVGVGAEFGAEALGTEKPRPILTQEEANEKFGIKGELAFDRNTPEAVAKELYELKRREIQRQAILSRGQGGAVETIASFGVGLGASILDPINIASAFVPVVGQARYAIWLGKYGTTGARALRGGLEGAVGAAVVEPIVLAGATYEQADYDSMDSLLNLTFGTVMGGGLHVGLGKIGDLLRGKGLDEQALRGSVSSLIEDRPVEIAGTLKHSLLQSSGRDFGSVFDALTPAELKAPVRAGMPDEPARLSLAERLNAASREYSEARSNLDTVEAAVVQRQSIRNADIKSEELRLTKAADEATTARGETRAALEAATEKMELAQAALEKAEGRANTLKDAGAGPEDRKLVKAEAQAEKARGPYQAAASEVERLKAEIKDLTTKAREHKTQLENFRENRRAESPETAEKARTRFAEAEQAYRAIEAERDERIRIAREEARTEAMGEIASRARSMHLSDEAEVNSITQYVERPEATKSGSTDIASLQEDLALMEQSIQKLRKAEIIPEGELKAMDAADEYGKQAEARAKAYESAALCQIMRRA